MIGGIDVHLQTSAGDTSVEIAVRAIRQRWSHAVFENSVTGERYDHFWQIPFVEIEELFVYQNSVFADAWDAKGAVPELRNTMIHLLSDDGMITVVVDDRDASMDEIISAIESALRNRDEMLTMELEAA